LKGFTEGSITDFKKEWARVDMLEGKTIELSLGDGLVTGVARGINDRGALLVETDDGLKAFHSGEVTFQKR
jgi:BirA family biotin operon repressor/biotin-[acetyl-CoA-carboxylase] ligase